LPALETESLEFRIQFDEKQRVLLITMGAVITEESVVAIRSAARLFLEAKNPKSVIADLSLVRRIEVSSDFIWDFATRPPASATGRPCVLVAPKDAAYGMSRMFQILRNTPRLEVVHSMKEALELFGLKALNFEPTALKRAHG
jgi:hypothetical protein